MTEIDLDNCIKEIQEFFLMEDKHYFDDITDYMCYRANQITMIVERNCKLLIQDLKR